MNGGRKIQRATVGTKVKHWKGLVSVTKGLTKFQKVTNYTVLIVLKQGTPYGNIQSRRNGNSKACVIELSRRKDSTMSVDKGTRARTCFIIKKLNVSIVKT